MATDEEIEKTIRESEEIIRKSEEFEREIQLTTNQTKELYEKYQINPDKMRAYLQEGDMTPDQKKELNKEKEKFDIELNQEIEMAQERYKMEKRASSGIQKTGSRRMRQMV